MNHQPPKLPLRFLRWFCDPRLLIYIEGDLLELFEERVSNKGYNKAKWFFVWEVIRLFRPGIMRKFNNTAWNLGSHFQYQVRSSLRTMGRQKFYTGVIMMSMVVAITLIHLLLAFLEKTADVDSFVPNAEHKYRLMTDDPFETEKLQTYIMDTQVEYIRDNYPDYKEMTNIYGSGVSRFKVQQDEAYEPVVIGAEPNFLKFFGLELSSGNGHTAINPKGIVLSKKMAERFFQNNDPLGKLVHVFSEDSTKTLQVTGVLDLSRYNFQLDFDAIVFEKSFKAQFGGATTYLELFDETNKGEFEERISQDESMPFLWKSNSSRFALQPFDEIYYDPASSHLPFMRSISKRFVLVGWIMTGMILLISFLNFVNLFLLASIKRRKELGVKKILGVSLVNIYSALVTDIVIYLLAGFAISLVISIALLDSFNYRFETSLVTFDLLRTEVLLILGGMLLLILLVSVFYTHSRINAAPIRMLTRSADFKIKLNKFLLSPQFVGSIILSICSLMILEQVDYIRKKPLGFDREVLNIGVKGEENMRSLKVLKEQLISADIVNSAALSSGNPLMGVAKIGLDLPEGGTYTPCTFSGDKDYFSTMGISIKYASNDTLEGAYVNETLVNLFGWDDPIGKGIPGVENRVAGVVSDFNMFNFYEKIPPVFIQINRDKSYSNLVVNFKGRALNNVLEGISEKWEGLITDQPFVYKDLNVELMLKHKDETQLLNIVTAFAFGGIVIACFGLFALSWGIAQNRTKEIGIRKVVGASLGQIIGLLTRNYLKWVTFAYLVACPISYLLLKKWLEHFAYRVRITPEVFISVGLATILIALLIVGFHATRVGTINPVNSLRDE